MKYKVEIEGEIYKVEVEGGPDAGKYRVKVGDREFTANVEGGAGAKKRRLSTKAVKTGAAAPQPGAEKPSAAGPASGAGTLVNAPMAGRVTRVYVRPGDKVKKGQLLFILEAMKMENEILSPCAGAAAEVMVEEGANVGHSSPLCRIE